MSIWKYSRPKRDEHKIVSSPGAVARETRVRRHLSEFAADTAGDVLIMFGLMSIVMFMMIGAAIDTGRWLSARDQTVNAIDAAVLAAGRALQTNGGNQAAAVAVAEKYYAAAIKNRLKTKTDTIKFIVVDNGTAVTATGTATIVTPFMGFGGVKSLPLLNAAQGEQPKATLAVGGNAETNLEISMMLDVSGSMCGSSPYVCSSATKLNDMKTAAKDLVDIVVWKDQSKFTSKVAIVPFSSDVRPPSTLLSLVTAVLPSKFTRTEGSGSKKKTYYFALTPCVGERTGTNKYTDVVASLTNPATRVYNEVSSSTATTAACQIGANATVKPLANDKVAIKASIDALTAQGGTSGHVGTAWTYYMLSPSWSSLLTGIAKPNAYGDEKHKKIAILMTDGEYNYTYDPDKAGTTATAGTGSETSSLNQKSSAYQATQICAQMKSKGIEVYTVGFELGSNATAISTLNSCATDSSHAYKADDGEQLKQAFRDIALKISSLYLSK